MSRVRTSAALGPQERSKGSPEFCLANLFSSTVRPAGTMPRDGDVRRGEMERVAPFSAEDLTSIAKILGDTDKGLKGSEIDHVLRQCKVPDPTPLVTKWKRLYNAFVEAQNKHQVGNHALMFIN